ncbi:MAG: outer membrane protein assembly factor BamA [Deltaproteobacteria bacterium]|nr:MAG: outer membrane protein assembly factor BamA [Deltaproteobacteria bacterium]
MVNRVLTLALSIVLVAALAWGESPSSFEGRKIGEIKFYVESPLLISEIELKGLLPFTEGERFSRDLLSRGIRALVGSGLFRKVEAYGEASGENEIRLLFRLFPEVPLTRISVKGEKYFSEREIISASGLKIGTTVTRMSLVDAERRVASLYKEHGYFSASVHVRGACSLRDGEGEVRFDVHEGPPPVLTRVEVLGNRAIDTGAVEEALGLVVGEPVSLKKIRERVMKLRRRYQRKGYLTATVREVNISKAEKGAALTIRVDEGEKFTITFTGNTSYSREKLEKIASLDDGEERTLSEVLSAIKQRVEQYYREKGFFQAVAEAHLAGREIQVTVKEGVRGIVGEVSIEGNESVPDEELLDRMETSPRGFFSFITGTGILREEELRRDLENLTGYYQSIGFPNARVRFSGVEERGYGSVEVKVEVDEGERYIVDEIEFDGVTYFTEKELLSSLSNSPGRPVDYVSAHADTYVIQKRYLESGFDDCRVEVAFAVTGKGRMRITYRVYEGPRYRLGRVLVRGLSVLSPDVVLRELPLKRGDYLDESLLVDFQRTLYRTGLFKRVRLKKVKEEEKGILNLVVIVEESDFVILEVGAGYGTDTGYRATVGVKHKSLNRYGRSLEGKMKFSERETRVTSSLREPWFLGFDVKGTLSASYLDEREESFSLESLSLAGTLTWEFLERSSFSFQVEFSDERQKEVSAGALLTPEDISLTRTVVFRPVFILDLRDDPFNPRDGSYTNFSSEISSSVIGSELDYVKTSGQVVDYFPLSRRSVFVLSGRGGYIRSLKGGIVPIERRFFLGGRTTVRGFEENRLGPRGADGTPIGGDTMVVGNAELRYFLTSTFAVGVFVDAGSLWIRGDEDYPFDLRETAGFSLKYITPVGPISFDMGFKLDRKEDEPASAWHFTVGLVF